jgi:hypothetical protein
MKCNEGDLRKPYNLEPPACLYSSPGTTRILKEDMMGRACSTHEMNPNACRTVVGNPEGRSH